MIKNNIILGNGFDLSHGIPSSYNNFIKLACIKYPCDKLVLYLKSVEEDKGWIDAENEIAKILIQFSKLKSEFGEIHDGIKIGHEYYEFFNYLYGNKLSYVKKYNKKENCDTILSVISFGDNMHITRKRGRITLNLKYIGEILEQSVKNLLELLKNYFVELNDVIIKNQMRIKSDFWNDIFKNMNNIACYNFNYLNTIKLYGINEMSIVNMHGTIQKPVFGSNYTGVNDFHFFNKKNQIIANNFGYKNILDNSRSNLSTMSNNSTNVHIIGHSLDENDYEYIKRVLFRKDKFDYTELHVYYYSEADKFSKIEGVKRLLGEDKITEEFEDGRLKFIEIPSLVSVQLTNEIFNCLSTKLC